MSLDSLRRDGKLARLRRDIDSIDKRIVALLNQRAGLAKKIGAEKKRDRLRVYEPGRETQVLAKVEALRRGPLDADGLARIYKAIMLTMRLLQKQKQSEAKALSHK